MTRTADPTRSALGIAAAAGSAFAAFYIFYTAAPVIFSDVNPSAGTRVAIVMAVVVAVQPLVLILGRWTRDRRRTAMITIAAMGVGSATLPFGGHWPGPLLLGAGFGFIVVTGTAWIRDVVPLGQLGRAYGIYGFGSAIGGAVGAPIGLLLAHQVGLVGVAVAGALFSAAALVPAFMTRTGAESGESITSLPTSGQHPTEHHPIGRDSPGWRSGYAVVAASAGGQLLAVTVYATVLSSVGTLAEGPGITVASAFAIQAFLSIGRLGGGTLCDRWSLPGTGATAFVVLVVGSLGFWLSSSLVAVIGASALVGLASGACQTAALTALMRRAHNARDTDRASTLWNICFDLGLGIGAFIAGQSAQR